MKVACVVADNGEVNLERCLASLRSQSVRPYVIVASGPKTDVEVAVRYADRVMEPVEGIGRARVKAIVEADAEYIISCDSDTVYAPGYVEYALQSLQLFPFVKAGTILPLDTDDVALAYAESLFSPLIPYEFALAFRRKAFLEAELDKEDYSSVRSDIGMGIVKRMIFVFNDPRMVCYTRLPTKGAVNFRENYLLSALGAAAPLAVVGGLIGYSLFT